MENIQVLYQKNKDFKHFVDHWSAKHNVTVKEVLGYEITRLVALQYQDKMEDIKYEYEIRQDNGI